MAKRKSSAPCLTDRQRAEIICELHGGASVCSIMRKYGIDESAVYYIMRKFGIERRKWRRWTAEEDDLIRKYYPINGGSWAGWYRLMPERNPSASDIHTRAHKLGIKRYG